MGEHDRIPSPKTLFVAFDRDVVTARCPDRDDEMREAEHRSNYSGDGIRIDTGSGI